MHSKLHRKHKMMKIPALEAQVVISSMVNKKDYGFKK